ncbi:MAG TPA: hypothetical protein VJM08_05740 [Anaerolineales bacterium]|nr:hypothetical protein [Anaerolineales bacterium]
MKKPILLVTAIALTLTFLLQACGNVQTLIPTTIPIVTDTAVPTVTVTKTPDVCATENIRAEVDKVHKHMREFDDAATLAANIPREQLSVPIADLQRIRREAEDEVVPPCITTLKDYQIQHMNSVISTLITFLSINDPRAIDCVDVAENSQEAAICQNIMIARQQHDQYTLELARILGITVVPANAATGPSQTPTP